MFVAFAASAAVAAAAPADEREGPIPPIIVTARRRDEDVQTVPAAISVVSGDVLDRSYTINTQGLAALAPSLNYSSANPRNTAFTIRGLGSSVVAVSQANDGLEPGVGYYVDQVYHGRAATAAFDFGDIERVEVLRGPQGTLFGKNSTAGAISISTRLPSFTPEVSGELSVGQNHFVQAKVSASGPLTDGIALRLSGLSTARGGVIHNAVSGRDHNRIGNQAVRGQLLARLGGDAALRLIGDFASFSSECCTQVPLRVGTSLRPAARQYPALAAGLGYAPPSFDPYNRLTDIDAPLGVATDEGGVAAIVEVPVGAARVTSVSAWRYWSWDAANDRDYTGLPIQLVQHIPSHQDQYSQELRAAVESGPFSAVGGLFFFTQTIKGRPISVYGPMAAYWLIGPTTGTPAVAVPGNLLDGYGQDGSTRFSTESYAAFVEASWTFLPRLTLTGGLRYTYETKRGDYATIVSGGLATTNAALSAAKLSVLRPQVYTVSDKDGSASGRANLRWQASDRLMAYASVARGFKSGGINMSGLPLNAQNQPTLSTAVIRPERNTTVEAGIKTTLLNRRLLANVTAYSIKVEDFQATVVDSSQTVALRGYLSNIPEVRVEGVEADALWRPLSGFSLRGALAYADGVYSDYPAGPCPLEAQGTATAACSLTGQRLAGLSRWAASLGGTAELPVGGGAILINAESSWRSRYNGDSSLSRFTLIDGYNLTNGSIGYRSERGWELLLFVRNLFDADFIQNVTIQAGNSGLILGTPSDPRMIGATFRVRR